MSFYDLDGHPDSLSDVSEVDDNELKAIVQSASSLDKKYHGEDSEGFQPIKEVLKKKQPKDKEDLLEYLNNVEGTEAVVGDIPSHYVFHENVGPIGHSDYHSTFPYEKPEKLSRSPADWLGLKESPNKSQNINDKKSTKLNLSPSADVLLKSIEKEENTRDLRTKKKGASDPSSVLPLPVSNMTTPSRYTNKNKGILMSELFGDMKITSDDTAVKIGVDSSGPVTKPTTVGDGDKKSLGYMPSSATPRRPERRLDSSSSSNPLGSGPDVDLDWLLGTKPSFAKESPKQTIKEGVRPRTAASPVTSTPLPLAAPSSAPKKDVKESKIPDWLEDIVKDSSQQKTETTALEDDPKKLPDWLGRTSSEAEQQAPTSPNTQKIPHLSQEEVSERGGNIITKLASVQTELVAAMSKRTENLQIYMQELMHEAARVVNVANVTVNSNGSASQENYQNLTAAEDRGGMNSDGAVKQAMEELKHKDDIIHDLEIKVNRLELQNEHLEMKIQNQLSTHEMEIDSLKKGHGFEISAWENRLERLKKTFEEASADYEEKITKLKEKEANLISEHKERIVKLEEERHEDLTKLGEFHRLAMEQAAAFTIQAPNINQTLRLPLRGLQRPKDEVELSERETGLLEKERQIELLKATLEAQRRELDEALEVEKIRREDRERETRRQTNETRLREEAREASAKREREQLDSLALQIKIMRDVALKEQGEIAREKLELAAERARLEATYSIQGRTEASLPPLDIMQARAEVEAALETARQAKEAAEQERRRQAEMRLSVEQITWEQKEMDIRLENREKHVNNMLKSAEKLRNEGLAAIDEAKAMKEEMESHQMEMKEQLRQIETKERVLAKERLEIAKEKIELERRKTQLELILPELDPAEELTIHPPRTFIDPKAVIMRLKAEKELESFMTTRK